MTEVAALARVSLQNARPDPIQEENRGLDSFCGLSDTY